MASENNGLDRGQLYYDTGELKYEGMHNDGIPHGLGTRFFRSGQKHMEGRFAGGLMVVGKEYYENGHLRFHGQYNQGPKTYYGPRYFVQGKLYYETGELWFEGSFKIEKHGSMGYPVFKGSESFYQGIEYDKNGRVIREHTKYS